MADGASPYQFKSGAYSSHTLLLRSLPEKGEGRPVLDIGCADGYLGAILARRGYQVIGIEAPGRAGARNGMRIVEADLESGLPPLPLERFAYVICADVLEHLRSPASLLRQIRERLEPGGRLVASLPNSGHAYFRWTVLRGEFPALDRGLFDRTHLHFYTWRGWNDLLTSAGFAIERAVPTGVPVGLAVPRWESTALVRALERLSFESARAWKTMFAYQFVVVARAESA
ncbi:MAG: class I SAM-dependent methyltransferase [Bryobacteraceae bacterium]